MKIRPEISHIRDKMVPYFIIKLKKLKLHAAFWYHMWECLQMLWMFINVWALTVTLLTFSVDQEIWNNYTNTQWNNFVPTYLLNDMCFSVTRRDFSCRSHGAEMAYLCLVGLIVAMLWTIWYLGGFARCHYQPKHHVYFSEEDNYLSVRGELHHVQSNKTFVSMYTFDWGFYFLQKCFDQKEHLNGEKRVKRGNLQHVKGTWQFYLNI